MLRSFLRCGRRRPSKPLPQPGWVTGRALAHNQRAESHASQPDRYFVSSLVARCCRLVAMSRSTVSRAATHKPTNSVPSMAPGKYIHTPKCRAHTSSRESSMPPHTSSNMRLVHASCSTRKRKLGRSCSAAPLRSTIAKCSSFCRALLNALTESQHNVTSQPPSRRETEVLAPRFVSCYNQAVRRLCRELPPWAAPTRVPP